MKASDTVTYTLTCDNCENSYNSKEAFPKYQFCPCCMNVWLAGIKEVVEWVNEHEMKEDNLDVVLDWQSKLKEWGISPRTIMEFNEQNDDNIQK